MPPPARRPRAPLLPAVAAARLIAVSGPAAVLAAAVLAPAVLAAAVLAAPAAAASAGPAPAGPASAGPKPARPASARPASPSPRAAAGARGPDLARGSAYLVRPASLIDGHYAESFPGYADYGLTLDTAFALAATGDQDSALKGVVTFLDRNGQDPSGTTVSDWTGIGTKYASGGSIGKEALLAEIVGDSPQHFSGHNLITALNASVCPRRSAGSGTRCAAPGSYAYASSVFDQALGIMAQLRAGQASQAAAPAAYLESLQNTDGSFPSLIPSTGDQDVDSTAMSAMALATIPGAAAAADVSSAVAWIASRQEKTGGFPGAGGDSVNSAGLAIQAMSLRAARYQAQIGAAESFLAREQNADGGFNNDAGGPRSSGVRATAQAVSGAVGTSFAALHRNLSHAPPPPPPPRTRSPHPDPKRTVPRRPSASPAGTGPAAAAPSDPAPSDAAPADAAPAAPSHAPSAPATSGPPPGSAASGPAPHVVADVSHDSSIAADLWRAVFVVAGVAAVAIALLLVRRRRLYPSSGGDR